MPKSCELTNTHWGGSFVLVTGSFHLLVKIGVKTTVKTRNGLETAYSPHTHRYPVITYPLRNGRRGYRRARYLGSRTKTNKGHRESTLYCAYKENRNNKGKRLTQYNRP